VFALSVRPWRGDHPRLRLSQPFQTPVGLAYSPAA
jgi:hypothetical protein